MKTRQSTGKNDVLRWINNMGVKTGNLPKYFSSHISKDDGFTLIEILVVLIIVMILVACALPAYSFIKKAAKISRAKAEIRVVERSIFSYYTDRNRLPDQLADIPEKEAHLMDPWSHPYQYFNIVTGTGGGGPQYRGFGINLNSDFDLYSMGMDGESDHNAIGSLAMNKSSDDLVRTGDGGDVVLGEDY